MDEVIAKYEALWGKAVLVPYRICGNRTTYAITDHNGHWVSLVHGWDGKGQMVFEERKA